MNPHALAAYVLSAMTAWVAPKTHPEGEAAAVVRYTQIADDIAAVALDPKEKPAFEGDDGRIKTALLLASIASLESGYRADIDQGRTRGDHGVSWCLVQVQVWGTTAEGWTGRDLVADRTKCLKAGLHRIHTSFAMCAGWPIENRLSGYTIGTCKKEWTSRTRTHRALAWLHDHPVEPDADERALLDPFPFRSGGTF
jgi:hypothetical protein